MWAEMNAHSASVPTSYGGFVLPSMFQFANKSEEDTRYSKDCDIVKADAAELPLREKVFLLVNRILNDKMSLPGYLYRHLILKHKQWIMFGDVGSSYLVQKQHQRSVRGDGGGGEEIPHSTVGEAPQDIGGKP